MFSRLLGERRGAIAVAIGIIFYTLLVGANPAVMRAPIRHDPTVSLPGIYDIWRIENGGDIVFVEVQLDDKDEPRGFPSHLLDYNPQVSPGRSSPRRLAMCKSKSFCRKEKPL